MEDFCNAYSIPSAGFDNEHLDVCGQGLHKLIVRDLGILVMGAPMVRNLTAFQTLLCIVFALGLGFGQILMKLAAVDIQTRLAKGIVAAALSPLLVGTLFFYGLVTALWIYILRQAPLSLAYPFSLLGSALVPFMAFALLKEHMMTHQILGMAVVCGGLLIMYGR